MLAVLHPILFSYNSAFCAILKAGNIAQHRYTGRINDISAQLSKNEKIEKGNRSVWKPG
jgi:hypothetical protein